ncbi:DNA double-strand break repair protein Mre11 [uncultured archaeon]|nr:DNA double-strand break repair protein Mre11 [uncultured archaeon]
MIVGILSDTHLGYPRFYEDSFSQFDEAFRAACDASDVVIIPGDIFDTKVPRFEVIAQAMHLFEYGKAKDWAAKGVRRVDSPGMKDNVEGDLPVVAIHGTHDRRSKEMINPVQLLAKSGFVTNASDGAAIFEKDGEKVAIHGFGGTPEDEVHEALKARELKPIPGAYNILVSHQTITDVIPVAQGITLEDLPPGFDLYLNGHIHKRHLITRNGKTLLIPGSTVITQLKKEEEEPRAWVRLDTRKKEIKFIDIKSRPFRHIELSFEKAEPGQIADRCRKEIEAELAKGEDMPIIRVQLKGSVKEGLKRENIDLSSLNELYGDRCHLQVDNELDSQGLKEKMESLRKMYEQKMSVREIGVQMLKQKLAATAKANGSKAVDVERLMDLLQDDGSIDAAIEEMTKE